MSKPILCFSFSCHLGGQEAFNCVNVSGTTPVRKLRGAKLKAAGNDIPQPHELHDTSVEGFGNLMKADQGGWHMPILPQHTYDHQCKKISHHFKDILQTQITLDLK